MLISAFGEAFGRALAEGLAKGLGLIFLVVYYVIFSAVFLFGDLLIAIYKLLKKQKYGMISRIYTHIITLALFVAAIYIAINFLAQDLNILSLKYINLWLILLIPLLIATIFSIFVELKGVFIKKGKKK